LKIENVANFHSLLGLNLFVLRPNILWIVSVLQRGCCHFWSLFSIGWRPYCKALRDFIWLGHLVELHVALKVVFLQLKWLSCKRTWDLHDRFWSIGCVDKSYIAGDRTSRKDLFLHTS